VEYSVEGNPRYIVTLISEVRYVPCLFSAQANFAFCRRFASFRRRTDVVGGKGVEGALLKGTHKRR
jgi:hypothetical protein